MESPSNANGSECDTDRLKDPRSECPAETLSVGIAAAVATLVSYTSGSLYGFTLHVYFTGSILSSFIRAIYSKLLYSYSVYIYEVSCPSS
jgi:hypothetical protein